VEYLGLETEKTAMMGKNHYNVTDSNPFLVLVVVSNLFYFI